MIGFAHFPLRSLDGDLACVIKAAEDFDWERISFILEAFESQPLPSNASIAWKPVPADPCKTPRKSARLRRQIRGKTVETYLSSHQDKAKNALVKSWEAAFQAWLEELVGQTIWAWPLLFQACPFHLNRTEGVREEN